MKTSTRPTALRSAHRIDRSPVALTDDVYFGSLKIPVARLLSPGKIALGGAAKSTVEMEGEQMILGRDPACDYPIESPLVSWHHARLGKTANRIEIEDLRSRNGTFVGGVRLHGGARITTGSVIALGALRLRLIDKTGRIAPHNSRDHVTVEAAPLFAIKQTGMSGFRRGC